MHYKWKLSEAVFTKDKGKVFSCFAGGGGSSLGYKWAGNCHHLSHGMVNLPSGKMKSREGTVIDADDLIEEVKELAKKEIKERKKISIKRSGFFIKNKRYYNVYFFKKTVIT
jgi:hypothetical protein